MLGVLAGFWLRFSRISPAARRFHLTPAAMKNHLPERWTEYSAVGRRIPGTRFITFKVPLQKVFDSRLAPSQRFSPTNLISEIEKQNEELGLVVDLTCTKRYYTPQEFPATIQYAKIFTAGKQIPSDDVICQFKTIVKNFLSENSENDKLVGVHCTHGLNRTGYLVCRYMIDVLGVLPSEAIESFNKSRGHCIERENYLDDLLQGKPRSQPSANPSWTPRLSAPPPPGQYMPGPPYSFHQTDSPGFPFINHAPWIPPSGLPNPPVPGPGHHHISHPPVPGPGHPRFSHPPVPGPGHHGISHPPVPGPGHHGISHPPVPGPGHHGISHPPGPGHHGISHPPVPGPGHHRISHPPVPGPGHHRISHPPVPGPGHHRISHPPVPEPGHHRISHPPVPGPGHPHIPQTEEEQHFRGGSQRHRHHPKRYFAQQLEDRHVNGTPGWHSAPYIPQKYGDSYVNGTDSWASGPQRRNGPYSRGPGQGRRGHPGEQ